MHRCYRKKKSDTLNVLPHNKCQVINKMLFISADWSNI